MSAKDVGDFNLNGCDCTGLSMRENFSMVMVTEQFCILIAGVAAQGTQVIKPESYTQILCQCQFPRVYTVPYFHKIKPLGEIQ